MKGLAYAVIILFVILIGAGAVMSFGIIGAILFMLFVSALVWACCYLLTH